MKQFIFLFLFFSLLILASCTPKLHIPKYERKDYKHWLDIDRDCQNTRQEILISRSLEKVVFKNKKKCTVVDGKWEDYYFPQIHTKAKEVDIDHLIPLQHAHYAGAYLWSSKKKKEFANDPENLVITEKIYNRQKGAKAIHEWVPVHKEYACKYIRDWIKIKNKYGLVISKEERTTIEVSGCP